MTAEKAKILITFEDKLLTLIDDYRFDNRINSRSEAIRRLIESGLGTSSDTGTKKKGALKSSAKGNGK